MLRKTYYKALSGIHCVSFIAPLLGRIAVGWIFLLSGWGKLHNLPQVVEYFESLGIPMAKIQAPFAAGTEFVGGLLLLLGLGTRVISIPLMVIMAVAIRTAKWEEVTDWNSFFMLPETLIAVVLLFLLFGGAGKASLDHLFSKCKK